MSRALSAILVLAGGGLVLLLALGPEPDASPRPVITASRIVSLGPSFTEIVLFLGGGDRLVGVTDFCENVPDSVRRVGTFSTPDVEAILGLEPDCVLGVASKGQAGLFADLRRLGLPVEVLGGDSVSDIRGAVVRLGELLEADAVADRFVEELDRRLASSFDFSGAPTVAFVIHHEPLYVAGRGSFVGGMLEAAGWRNAFGDSDASWVQIEAEDMVQRQPDAIVDTTLEPLGDAGHRVWEPFAPHMEAVRSKRVFAFPPVTPGVRIPEWIDRLVEIRKSTPSTGESRPRFGGKLRPR